MAVVLRVFCFDFDICALRFIVCVGSFVLVCYCCGCRRVILKLVVCVLSSLYCLRGYVFCGLIACFDVVCYDMLFVDRVLRFRVQG